MPSSSSRPASNLLDFDIFNTFEPTEEVNKVKSSKKNKRKNETAQSEQFDSEKTTSINQNDEYEPENIQPMKKTTNDNSQESHNNPFLSQAGARTTPNTYASPVFAALGNAFKDKSFEKALEEHPQETLSTSSQRQQPLRDISPSIPPSRSRPHAETREGTRGGFSHQPPPTVSPRLAYQQLSRRPSGYQHQTESLATSPRGRPVSMPAQMYHLPSPSGFNLNQMRGITNDPTGHGSARSTSRKASKYNFVALDTLVSAGDVNTCSSENVLLAAHENSISVFHLAHDKAVRIGRIDGLRGYVVSAKIIPSPNRRDPLRTSRPLIAVIVHGPEIVGEEPSRPSSRHSDQSFDPSYPHDSRTVASVTKYQTSVEIYSLKKHAHIATLFVTRSEEPKIDNVFGRKSYEIPSPIGGLSVHVTNCYIAVSSIESGEIYVYDTHSGQSGQHFRCIGKTWTSVPHRKSRTWSSSSAPEEEGSKDRSPIHQRYEAPLLALQGRLLVYVPPISSSRSTIFGRIRLPMYGKEPPGLKSHTASSQPHVTSQLETPLDGGRMNEIARGVTQEMLKGAKWVGDQSMQAWKNYWSPKSPDLNAQVDYAPPNPQFPPTHASDDPTRMTQQPTVVSFLDLDKLSDTEGHRAESALQPIASFSLPGGCSFMDLSPAGLTLFTASAKGDVQNVWDLMQILYPKSSITISTGSKSDNTGTIRQIARFTRITTACIVDVAWFRGSKLAILTDRGTVHLHDLPSGSLDWPPRETRRDHSIEFQHVKAASQVSTPSGWGSALSAVSSGAQSISAAVRSNPLAQFSNINLAHVSAGAGAKGGKIVAAGFSRSVEAASGTVSSIMSIGETRLHIPGISRLVVPGSARWWSGRDLEAIAVVGDGLVRVHKVMLKKDVKHGRKRTYSVVGDRVGEVLIPEPHEKHEGEWEMVNDGHQVSGEWIKRSQPRKHSRSRSTINPLSSAEIETSAPFRSLYADHRVELENYTANQHESLGAWAFGQPISSEPLNDAMRHQEDDFAVLPQPNETTAVLVQQIEEALPIAESPPKAKSKKGKKGKGKQVTPPPEIPLWPADDTEEPVDDLNDLMI